MDRPYSPQFLKKPSLSLTDKFKKKQITKGLLNPTGHNNCFLNVVIQALFHLKNFREKFDELSQQNCPHREEEPCVFCNLKGIFEQYQSSDEINIAPDTLRKTLAFLYRPEMKFQLEKIDDAGEALDAVLEMLHRALCNFEKSAPQQGTDVCHCVAHSVFGMELKEQLVCNACGHRGDPICSQVFNVYAYTMGVLEIARTHPTLNFGQSLRQIDLQERTCSNSDCGKQASVCHFIHNPPTIFSIGVVWDTDQPTSENIQKFLDRMDTTIKLEDIFSQVVVDSNKAEPVAPYALRGLMCYYGQHYSAFFFHEKTKNWFSFDDTSVRPISVDFLQVKEKCVKGKLQPSVLFYERAPTSPPLQPALHQDTAPSKIGNSSLPLKSRKGSKVLVLRAENYEDASKLLSTNQMQTGQFADASPSVINNLFTFIEEGESPKNVPNNQEIKKKNSSC